MIFSLSSRASAGSLSAERKADEARLPTDEILRRFAPQNDRGAVILSVSGGACLQSGRLMKHAFLQTRFFVALLLRMTGALSS